MTPPIPEFSKATGFAMSAAAFVPERSEIWFTDGNSGFYAIRVTNGVWPFTTAATAKAAPTRQRARVEAPVLAVTR